MDDELKKEILGSIDTHLEKSAEKTDAALSDVNASVKSLATELAEMKEASVYGEMSGISKADRTTLGALAKAAYGVDSKSEISLEKDALVEKAQILLGDASGSALKFPELYKGILGIAPVFGAFLRDTNVHYTSRDQVNFVKENDLGNIGSFVTEAGTISEDNMTFDGSITVSPGKWAKMIGISEEAMEDSAPEDIGNFIVKELAEKFGQFVDFHGFSTVLAQTGAGSVTADVAALTRSKFVELVNQVPVSVLSGSAFYVSRSVWAKIASMEDTTGRPLVDNRLGNGVLAQRMQSGITPAGYIEGYPVFTTDYMPAATGLTTGDKFVYFGNLAESTVLVMRKEFNVTVSTEFKFDKDIISIKGKARVRAGNLLEGAGAFLVQS